MFFKSRKDANKQPPKTKNTDTKKTSTVSSSSQQTDSKNNPSVTETPILTNIVALGSTPIAIQAIKNLIAERELHHALLLKLEQHDFPEIATRCQTEIQAHLQESLAGLSGTIGEHMGRMLRAELRVAMMHLLSAEKSS